MLPKQLTRLASKAMETKIIRVYLAGKIYRGPDWRSKLSFGDTPFGYEIHKSGPHFISCDHGCFHGDGSHGRGAADDARGCNGIAEENEKHDTANTPIQVVWSCLQWIKESDAVFVWIDKDDAYGTLVEIGIAIAIGKPVFFATPPDFGVEDLEDVDFDRRMQTIYRPNKPSDMWFAKELADMKITAESASAAWDIFKALADRLVESSRREQKWYPFL